MSHGTNILFTISLFKLSELSPSWVLNVTEILESLLTLGGPLTDGVEFESYVLRDIEYSSHMVKN